MPGHIGAFQLDVQFGSLSFGEDSGGFSIGDDKPSSGSFSSTAGRYKILCLSLLAEQFSDTLHKCS